MSLGLLLPIGLAALAALLLPVLLHLERRTEPRATPFAALRWLSMQSRPQRRVRLEELWLLLLRLLLVAAVALVFARPVLFGSEGGRAWALVAPGVDVAQARTQFRDPNARWHWLAPEFPEIDGAGSAPSIPSAAQAQAQSKLQDQSSPPPESQPVLSLLREIDASLPAKTALTVFVPAQLDGLDGERPRLGRDIEWRIVPGTAVSARATPAAVAPALVVRHTADRAASVRYLRAAAIAWHASEAARMAAPMTAPPARASRLKPLPHERDATSAGDRQVDIASSAQPIPATARWLVWLAPGELPAPVRRWVEAGGTAVLDERSVLADSMPLVAAWRDADGRVLANYATLGGGRVIRLTRPLLPAANADVLDAQFPARLRALFDGPSPPPQRALAAAIRPLAGGRTYAQAPQPLDPWLAMFAAGLFVLERWFASSARRRRAA